MPKSKVPEDVDGYIATAPEASRQKLLELRAVIRAAAPQAEEVISYHMPYYKQHGQLVGFAAFNDHVSLFGAIPKGFSADLKGYAVGRGSIQFPYDRPLPAKMIARLVKAHVKINQSNLERSAESGPRGGMRK